MTIVQDSTIEPPFTDRGVVNAIPRINRGENEDCINPVDIVIDWMQFTIQAVDVDTVLQGLFHVSSECCQHTPSGRFGYNNTYTYTEKIHVMYHDSRSDMGVHILLSGSACRVLEDLISWSVFFDRILSFDYVKFTRIDIAIDTYRKFFDIALLRRKIIDGELVSKFRKSTYMEQLNVANGNAESASLKFGSMSSDIYIVFYDKLAERHNAGYTVSDSVDFWVRTELRFKHDLATKLVTLIVQNGYVIGSFIYEILYNYIDFKDYDPSDKTKSRWETSQFWLDFLGTVGKLSIAPKAQQTTIERKRNYVDNYMCKLMTMLRVVDNDFYDDIFKKGFERITQQDLDIINAHLISVNKDVINMEDMRILYSDIVSRNDGNISDQGDNVEIHKQLAMGLMPGDGYER